MLLPANGLGAKVVFDLRDGGGVQLDVTATFCELAIASVVNNTRTTGTNFTVITEQPSDRLLSNIGTSRFPCFKEGSDRLGSKVVLTIVGSKGHSAVAIT